MYGAILGDMIGAPYEFDRGDKTKDFPLFSSESQFTDDTVMTIAVAQALMDTAGEADEKVKSALIFAMQRWGRKYPHAGYGGRFGRWLGEKYPVLQLKMQKGKLRYSAVHQAKNWESFCLLITTGESLISTQTQDTLLRRIVWSPHRQNRALILNPTISRLAILLRLSGR